MAKKYIDADLLRKESERLRKLLEDHNYYLDNSEQSVGYANALLDIENFLDTLSEEPDKSLEEAAEEYTQKMLESWRFDSTGCRPPRESFIAGAEWQASQMPMPEDTVLFNKGVAEGRRLEREDMLKDAIEWEVIANLANRPVIYLYQLHGFKPGDKVRIVVLKEEDE